MTNEELAQYFRKRLGRLEDCNAHFEMRIGQEAKELLDGFHSGEIPKDSADKVAFHLELVLGNTYRYVLIGAICSFLEEAMATITERLVSDYAKQFEKRKGNFLKRDLKILRDSAGFKDSQIADRVKKFNDLIELRNCIVHVWGKIARSKKPKDVEEAVKSTNKVHISEDDGYLILEDGVVANAISLAEEIVESVLNSKLDVSLF